MRLATSHLALVTVALLATAASPGGCGPGDTGYDPCAGRACGDACRACPPDDPSCVETTEVKGCDPTGRCVSAGAFACGVSDPCAGKACGADCTYDPACRYSSPPCMMPSYAGKCDSGGQCQPPTTPPDCAPPPPPWGCEGKKCGDSCGYCPPGTDPANCPVPTFAATACNDRGECVTAGTFTCEPVDPCAGKACGEPCDIGLMGPMPTLCNSAGLCRYALATPEGIWSLCEACAGKTCGESCDPRPPGTTCVAVMSACDPLGACTPDGSFSCK